MARLGNDTFPPPYSSRKRDENRLTCAAYAVLIDMSSLVIGSQRFPTGPNWEGQDLSGGREEATVKVAGVFAQRDSCFWEGICGIEK